MAITNYKKRKAYELVRVRSGKLYMEAAYCKYYFNLPYAAIFAEYPVPVTKVVVLRKVAETDTHYGAHLCKLISYTTDGSPNVIGYYVPVRTVTSEKEATEAVEMDIRGNALVAEALGGNRT